MPGKGGWHRSKEEMGMETQDRFVCWFCPGLFVPNSKQLVAAAHMHPVFCSRQCRDNWTTRYGVSREQHVDTGQQRRGRKTARNPFSKWKGRAYRVVPWWKPGVGGSTAILIPVST